MHSPFAGDRLIGEAIRRLVAKYEIRTIVETGTWSAHSTREFAKMGPLVYTIDATHDHLLREFGTTAVTDLVALGIRPIMGDSVIALPRLLAEDIHPCLIYLDAHGGENGSTGSPLLLELEAIGREPKCRDRTVICIHDFFVPGKPWGFNSAAWGRYSYEVIARFLPAIYPSGHAHSYNEEAKGMKRGIIYIEPVNKISLSKTECGN